MEKPDKVKVFVKINQVWQKGEVTGGNEQQYAITTRDGQSFNVNRDSSYVEEIQRPSQRYAYGDIKEKLQGQYISFDKLPSNVKDQLVDGREYLHTASYLNEGELKESVKMIQAKYDANYGSKLHVQIKRNSPVKIEDAVAYNHRFSQKEFDAMVKDGKAIMFQGNTRDGEIFQKLAYYEPKLNDIRTKPTLSKNVYFYGKKLTQQQADALNKGQEVLMKIDTAKGPKEYMVNYSPRSEQFITKGIDMKKAEKMEVNHEKKKPRSRGVRV